MKVFKNIQVKAHVRYWEDSRVNEVEDTENGDNMPCKQGDLWCPLIDIEKGTIKNWRMGVRAHVNYKVADGCGWELLDKNGKIIKSQKDGYVPDTFCPCGGGYGDYIEMHIDENGRIENWCFNPKDFGI